MTIPTTDKGIKINPIFFQKDWTDLDLSKTILKTEIRQLKFLKTESKVASSNKWSYNAEFRDDEDITLEHDTEQATNYALEYKRLIK